MEIKITVSSKIKFKVSGQVKPYKKPIFKGYVTASALNVRTWAGAKHKLCSFSPLKIGTTVEVCDAIQAIDGKIWYFIRFKDKYGFVNSSYIKGITQESSKTNFLKKLSTYHNFVGANSNKFKYGSSSTPNTFSEAKKRIGDGEKINLTCVVPIRWALATLGIKSKNFYAKDGIFQNVDESFFKKLKLIKTGKPIGMTVTQAVDKKLLKAGDICGFNDLTHTFVYSGQKYNCYDGGHAATKNGSYTGIKADYSNHYKSYKIKEILRWKD